MEAITIHFDFPEEPDQESIQAVVAKVPAIGEHVGVRPSDAGPEYRKLDRVLDVRHYLTLINGTKGGAAGAHEIRVLLGNG